MKESTLYPKIKKWITDSYPKAWVYRTTDTFRVGIPDFIACFDSFFLAIEVKQKESIRLTKIQEYELGCISNANGLAMVVKGDTAYINGREYQWKTLTFKEVIQDAQYRTVQN